MDAEMGFRKWLFTLLAGLCLLLTVFLMINLTQAKHIYEAQYGTIDPTQLPIELLLGYYCLLAPSAGMTALLAFFAYINHKNPQNPRSDEAPPAKTKRRS